MIRLSCLDKRVAYTGNAMYLYQNGTQRTKGEYRLETCRPAAMFAVARTCMSNYCAAGQAEFT